MVQSPWQLWEKPIVFLLNLLNRKGACHGGHHPCCYICPAARK